MTKRYVSGLINLIHSNMQNLEQAEEASNIQKHFENTLAHIRYKEAHPQEGDPDYSAIADATA